MPDELHLNEVCKPIIHTCHMFTAKQEELLNTFADQSDRLFDLGVITTDSFTGEIGEFYACQLFDLRKTNRVTKAVDGISKNGDRYQVKSKVIANNFNYNIKDLETNQFEYLVVVYFDKLYNLKKIVRIPAHLISNNSISITSSNIKSFESFDDSTLIVPIQIKKAIYDFAESYTNLEENGIIRSRRIVGDIGEFYACRHLNLIINENKNEKGIDARHENGLTFEIKTRRVYSSGRRVSETRRLNNLVGKTADYLVVVALDRSFKCAGMWLAPMQHIINPKSANLKIVNYTHGTLNVVPSKISWLDTGRPFNGFEPNNFSEETTIISTTSKKPIKRPAKKQQFNSSTRYPSSFDSKTIDSTYGFKKDNHANEIKFIIWFWVIVGIILILISRFG